MGQTQASQTRRHKKEGPLWVEDWGGQWEAGREGVGN